MRPLLPRLDRPPLEARLLQPCQAPPLALLPRVPSLVLPLPHAPLLVPVKQVAPRLLVLPPLARAQQSPH